jgi:hypothetical protein
VNGGPHFISYLSRNFVHAVISARVISALLKNILLAVALGDEIAVHTNISTADYLCHNFLQEQNFGPTVEFRGSIAPGIEAAEK